MKNKLSAVLAFTSILTMGNVNAENLSPWNNNNNFNPFGNNVIHLGLSMVTTTTLTLLVAEVISLLVLTLASSHLVLIPVLIDLDQ